MRQRKRAEAVISSAVPFVPFSRMASTGTRRGHRSHSLLIRNRLRCPRTGMRRVCRRRLRSRLQSCACRRCSGERDAGRCRPSVRGSRRRWRLCWWSSGFSWLSLMPSVCPCVTSKQRLYSSFHPVSHTTNNLQNARSTSSFMT